MRKFTLSSPNNLLSSKHVSFAQLFCPEINQKSTDDNAGWDASVVNQPLPLNYNTAASVRNGVSVSESEVSAV